MKKEEFEKMAEDIREEMEKEYEAMIEFLRARIKPE